MRVEAQVGAREKLIVVGWLWARAKQQDHWWRQWRAAAGGGVARAREEMRQGVLYAWWHAEVVSPHLRGLQEL
jgi:hypothetical protein